MRLDQFLSDLGLIKRRTVAKEMAEGGLVKLNGNRSKPAHAVKVGDIISISGSRPISIEVVGLPIGNVRKEEREKYYRILG